MMGHTEKPVVFKKTKQNKVLLGGRKNYKPNKIKNNNSKEDLLLLFFKITQTHDQLSYGRESKIKALFKIHWMSCNTVKGDKAWNLKTKTSKKGKSTHTIFLNNLLVAALC